MPRPPPEAIGLTSQLPSRGEPGGIEATSGTGIPTSFKRCAT